MPRARKIVRLVLWLVVGPIVLGFIMLGWAAGRHDAPVAVPGVTGIFRVHNMLVDQYAARSGDGVVLFDAGIDARGRPLDALLGALGATRKDVRAVFLSHGHPDHFAAASRLPGVTVYVGAADVALMKGQGPGGGGVRLWKWAFGIPDVTASELVSARHEITLPGGERVVIIPCPGHTAGSTLQLFHGVLFVGDAFVFQHGRFESSPEHLAADPAQARRSIAALPGLLAGLTVTTVCTGHGGCAPPEQTTALLQDLVHRAAAPP